MKKKGLTVEVPGGDGGEAATPPQPEALGPEASARSKGRFSPSVYMQKAANFLTTGIVRTPSRASSRQQWTQSTGRASVNPIERAAHDATYRHSLELTEQEKAAVAEFKKKPSRRTSSKRRSEKPVRARWTLWQGRALASGAAQGGWVPEELKLGLWSVNYCVCCDSGSVDALAAGTQAASFFAREMSNLLLPPPHYPLLPASQLTQDEEVRYVRHNEGPVGEFETNKVVTSKYNVATFLPLFLFEMFSRAAYLYFLLQASTGGGWE